MKNMTNNMHRTPSVIERIDNVLKLIDNVVVQPEPEMKSELPPVGKTAMVVAAARYLETLRDPAKRWYNDPFAYDFATEEGIKYLKLIANKTNRDLDFYCWGFNHRTRFYDEQLSNKVELTLKNPKYNQIQIIILGVGCDTRLYRLKTLSKYSNQIISFEIDLKNVIDYRNKILHIKHKAKPFAKIHKSLAKDLQDSKWGEFLIENGFDTKIPSIFLFEGLLLYIDEENLNHFINQIKCLQRNTINDSWIIGDCVNHAHPALNKIGQDAYKLMGKKDDKKEYLRAKSGIDVPGEFFKKYGYDIKWCDLGCGDMDYGVTPQERIEKAKIMPVEKDTVPRAFFFHGKLVSL